ncbi:hypothetical protein BGZ46_002064 [Entomortierella lignicola]|nr:hypothetical protein BGZ46_002064 [Entomortierella lignicola]
MSEMSHDNLPSVDEAHAVLQAYYGPSLSIQRVSGDQLDLESCDVNLTVVQGMAFNRQARYERSSDADIQLSIPLEDMFNRRVLRDGREDVPKTILIQGRAGIGKTTLCKKIVRAYQNGLWRDRFDSVLWLPLRQLKELKVYDLQGLLKKKYFASCPEEERESLTSALIACAREDRVLFVLDGLDEFLYELETTHDNDVQDEFLKSLVKQHHVIITSRPGVDMSKLPTLDLELETIGFNTQNVNDFLIKVFSADVAREVHDFIKRILLYQGLVNNPTQLDLVCYGLMSLASDKQHITMTELYRTMIKGLWCKDAIRSEASNDGEEKTLLSLFRDLQSHQLDSLISTKFEFFGYLAFNGMKDNHRIEFDKNFLEKTIGEFNQYRSKSFQDPLPLDMIDKLNRTSFLEIMEADMSARSNGARRIWYFLHPTFQEYFTATWIVRHLQSQLDTLMDMTAEETIAFIQREKYNPRYKIVWWMVAGLLEGKELVSLFDLLQVAPVDLIGGYHQLLLAGCLRESRSRLNDEVVARLESQLRKWLHFDMAMLGDNDYDSCLGSQDVIPEQLVVEGLSQSHTAQKYALRAMADRSHLTLSAIEATIGLTYDADSDIKIEAIKVLGTQSKFTESSIQALIVALKDENNNVRKSAATVLGSQNKLPDPAIQALITALHDEDDTVRDLVARALGAQPTLHDSDISSVIRILWNKDQGVQDSAVEALGTQSALPDFAIMALTDGLQHGDWRFRNSVAKVFGTQSTLPDSAIQALIGALQDENESVRYSASLSLGIQHSLPECAVQALVGALQDENENVRCSATTALGSQSLLPEFAIQALINVLQDEHGHVQIAAVKALHSQSALPESSLQALLNALQDEDSQVRSFAVFALGTQSRLPDNAIHALIAALQDEDRDVRNSAVNSLGTQALLSEYAIQALIHALRDGFRDVRRSSAIALGSKSILPESAIMALVDALQDEAMDVRCSAAKAIGKQPILSEAAIQALIYTSLDEMHSVRDSAVRALDAQSVLPDSALQALVGALQDQDMIVRSSAANALGSKSNLPDSAVLALAVILKDEDFNVRNSAVEALGTQSTLPDSVIMDLIRVLRDDDMTVCRSVGKALCAQSSFSASAIQTLIKGFEDERNEVRSIIDEVLDIHQPYVCLAFLKLSTLEIEVLYRNHSFRFGHSRPISIFVQGNQLFFYSSRGLLKLDSMTLDALENVVSVFRSVQNSIGSSAV